MMPWVPMIAQSIKWGTYIYLSCRKQTLSSASRHGHSSVDKSFYQESTHTIHGML